VSLGGGGNLSDLCEIFILDLHNNCLDRLPEEIGLLTKLTVRYMQLHSINNCLERLPEEIGLLTKLTVRYMQLDSNNNCWTCSLRR
jgi:hypothetical protein